MSPAAGILIAAVRCAIWLLWRFACKIFIFVLCGYWLRSYSAREIIKIRAVFICTQATFRCLVLLCPGSPHLIHRSLLPGPEQSLWRWPTPKHLKHRVHPILILGSLKTVAASSVGYIVNAVFCSVLFAPVSLTLTSWLCPPIMDMTAVMTFSSFVRLPMSRISNVHNGLRVLTVAFSLSVCLIISQSFSNLLPLNN